MKRFSAIFLVAVLVFSAVNVYAETSAEINVIFDRVRLVVNEKTSGVPTLVYDGRTYIQLKAVSEIFGAWLDWNAETSTAYLTVFPGSVPELEPENAETLTETPAAINVVFDRVRIVVNGGMTDVPTMVYNGRTYIQLKAVSEIFGAELLWDGETNTAFLTTVKEEEKEKEPKSESESEPVFVETTLKEGRYTVGKDITEGRYVISGDKSIIFEYIDETMKEATERYNSKTITLDLKAEQKFSISEKALFTPVTERKLLDKLSCGRWVVGLDIAEGRYEICTNSKSRFMYVSIYESGAKEPFYEDSILDTRQIGSSHNPSSAISITIDLYNGQEMSYYCLFSEEEVIHNFLEATLTPITPDERTEKNKLTKGIWIVGLDITPGEYTVTAISDDRQPNRYYGHAQLKIYDKDGNEPYITRFLKANNNSLPNNIFGSEVEYADRINVILEEGQKVVVLAGFNFGGYGVYFESKEIKNE